VRGVAGREGPVGYNSPVHVRPLAPDELDAALDLWARTEHLGPVPRAEVEQLRAFDPSLVLAADLQGVVVGVVLGSFDGRRGWINRLAVDPPARRLGVARALVVELERRLAERGCQQVNLLVFDDNDAGRALWRDLGYGELERVVLCSRRLTPADVGAPDRSAPDDPSC
jgi:ribosomal protein S18 acetylase RimI-like enzyme